MHFRISDTYKGKEWMLILDLDDMVELLLVQNKKGKITQCLYKS